MSVRSCVVCPRDCVPVWVRVQGVWVCILVGVCPCAVVAQVCVLSRGRVVVRAVGSPWGRASVCNCVPCSRVVVSRVGVVVCQCAGGVCGCASTSGCVTRPYLMVHPHVLVRSRATVLSVHVSVRLCTRMLVLHDCVWLCTYVRLLHVHVQSHLCLCQASVCSCASACGSCVPTCSPVCSCTCVCK